MVGTVWWCLKLMAGAGLPPLLLALLMSAILRWSRSGTAPCPRHVVWAAVAFAAYVIACALWWVNIYPGGNETGAWSWYYHNLLTRGGALIGIGWGLFRLVASNWRVLRTPEPRGFEVVRSRNSATPESAG